MNNFTSDIFQPLLWVEKYPQNSQAVLAATGMNHAQSLLFFTATILLHNFNPFMPGDLLDKCRLDLSYF